MISHGITDLDPVEDVTSLVEKGTTEETAQVVDHVACVAVFDELDGHPYETGKQNRRIQYLKDN